MQRRNVASLPNNRTLSIHLKGQKYPKSRKPLCSAAVLLIKYLYLNKIVSIDELKILLDFGSKTSYVSRLSLTPQSIELIADLIVVFKKRELLDERLLIDITNIARSPDKAMIIKQYIDIMSKCSKSIADQDIVSALRTSDSYNKIKVAIVMEYLAYHTDMELTEQERVNSSSIARDCASPETVAQLLILARQGKISINFRSLLLTPKARLLSRVIELLKKAKP